MSGAITEEERRYEDGSSPRLLDVIEIPMIQAAPVLYQSENYVIDQDYYWEKIGECLWNDLRNLIDEPASLWLNGDSTNHGQNDRVAWRALPCYKALYILSNRKI